MKKSSVIALFLMVGCSQFEAKKNVELPFSAGLLEKSQKSTRGPASLTVNDVEGKSSRRVYFSALYHQYLSMGHHLDKSNEIKFCPQFHHDKIETDANIVPRLSVYKQNNVESESREYFPELVFNRDFSLGDHFEDMLSELKVLCEEGVSDNFYKFDNLITHYAGSVSFHSNPEAMKSVLKIPVFANYYLIQMLRSTHHLGAVLPEEKRAIDLTRTYWFENYVAEAQRMRNNLIRNKMVLRYE